MMLFIAEPFISRELLSGDVSRRCGPQLTSGVRGRDRIGRHHGSSSFALRALKEPTVGGIEGFASMHNATVVPNDHVADLPRMKPSR